MSQISDQPQVFAVFVACTRHCQLRGSQVARFTILRLTSCRNSIEEALSTLILLFIFLVPMPWCAFINRLQARRANAIPAWFQWQLMIDVGSGRQRNRFDAVVR